MGFNGAGLNVGNVAASRKWLTRVLANGAWTNGETGKTFAEVKSGQSISVGCVENRHLQQCNNVIE